jgi:hypothetical protein
LLSSPAFLEGFKIFAIKPDRICGVMPRCDKYEGPPYQLTNIYVANEAASSVHLVLDQRGTSSIVSPGAHRHSPKSSDDKISSHNGREQNKPES